MRVIAAETLLSRINAPCQAECPNKEIAVKTRADRQNRYGKREASASGTLRLMRYSFSRRVSVELEGRGYLFLISNYEM
jgi:hypothetical protein